MLNRDFWSIKDFVLVKEVGSGAASTVYYALCRKSTQPVAIKMYLKSKLSKLNRRQVEREINIHSSLGHPHIIDFYAAFEDDDRIYLVQEYAAGGDLFDDVKRHGGRMPEREVVQAVLHPYLTALAYLHARGIIHRDIKPENTVFTRERVMKVTDFGLAIAAATERPVTRLGTLDYMAPEVLRCPDKHSPEDNKERADLEYDASVDVWAMGVLAYELVVGRPPFGMSCREATMRAIVAANPAVPEWMSAAAADFIRSALQRVPGRRAAVSQLLQHPWIAGHMAASRPCNIPQAPRHMPCGAEAAAAAAAAAGRPGSFVAVSAGAAGFASTGGAIGGVAAGASSHSQLYHPSGPYQRILAHPGGSAASASEAGGAAAGGAAPYGSIAAAAAAYGGDHRPTKRQVYRCQSANVDTMAAAAAAAALAAAGQSGSAQAHAIAAAAHHQYDNGASYWATDGNGFGYDPLAGPAALELQLLQQQPYRPMMWGGAAVAAAEGGCASGVSSPRMGMKAADFFAAQLARPGGGASDATAAAAAGGLQGMSIQDQFMLSVAQAQQQHPGHPGLQRPALSNTSLQQQQQQHLQQTVAHHPQVLQEHLELQQLHRQASATLHRTQQAYAQNFHEQQLQQQQQQQRPTAEQFPVGVGTVSAFRTAGAGVGVSGSGESAMTADEPPVPSLTAADYYRQHLADLHQALGNAGQQTESASGGYGAAAAAAAAAAHANSNGGGMHKSPGGRSQSRSFVVRSGGRAGVSTSGAAAAAAAIAAADTDGSADGGGGSGGGSGRASAAVSRLLRSGSICSSGGASMKRRTPDTHDWDLPVMPPALSQQLSLQFPLPQGPGQGPASYGQPISPVTSEALATAAAAAALYGSGGSGSGMSTPTPGAASASPFGLYSGSPMPRAAGGSGSGSGSGSGMASVPPVLQQQQLLAGSLSFTCHGSYSSRPSRLSKAFRRMDSLEPGELGVSAGASGGISDGSGCSGGAGGGAGGGGGSSGPLPSPLARRSGASAAVAAFDQLTLASALTRGNGGAVGSTADTMDDGTMAAAAALRPAVAASVAPSDCSLNSAFTALTAPSGGSMLTAAPSGTSGMSMSCFGGGGGTAAAPSGLIFRAPSMTAGGLRPSPQSVAALRLSLPTILPGPAGPTACSSTGGGGPRSHPLQSPQVTPWATPLSSPAASRLPRMNSTPWQSSAPTFNQLLDSMEAEEGLVPAGAAAAVAADADAAADGTAAAAALATADSGTLDGLDWMAQLLSSGGLGGMGGVGGEGLAEAMQLDDGAAGGGGGGGAMGSLLMSTYPAPHHMMQQQQRALAAPSSWSAGGGWAAAGSAMPPPPPAASMLQSVPDDRMLTCAWPASPVPAADAGGGGNHGAAAGHVASPPASTTGLMASPNGRSSVSRSGSFCTGNGGPTHVLSPLGRDTPQQQARAAAMQQHIRSRSLNRFQIEQMHIAAASLTGGVAAAASTAGLGPPPGLHGGGTVDGSGSGGISTWAMGSAGGGGGGGPNGGGVCWNRIGSMPSPSTAPLTGSPYGNGGGGGGGGGGVGGSPYGLQGHTGRSLACGYHPGSPRGGQRGGPAVPSPLGLRCSTNRRSSSSSGDAASCGPSCQRPGDISLRMSAAAAAAGAAAAVAASSSGGGSIEVSVTCQ